MEIFEYIKEQKRHLWRKIGSKQDAQDIIQDVYEIVWRKKEYFESKDILQQQKIITFCIRNRRVHLFRYSNMQKRKVDLDYFRLTSCNNEVFDIMELKEIIKRIEDENLQCLLDYAMGFTINEVLEKHKISRATLFLRRRKMIKRWVN